MINLPAQYQWLLNENGPQMIKQGLKIYGTKEIIGAKHNPVILKWAKQIGIEKLVKDDEQPWCGLAHGYVAYEAGKALSPLHGWDILRALHWAKWGIHVDEPMFGDTVIFKRPGGGHVGLYIAESSKSIHVMGGNSGNEYKIVEISKSRLVAARRPIYTIQPPNVRRIYVNSKGELSKNES